MKNLRVFNTLSMLMIMLSCTGLMSAQDATPQYISIELKHLEETWNILDQCASKIWPGWTNYADVPFLFTYTNGVQLLVGHPNPPEGFSPLPGFEVKGKKAYLDRRKEVPLAMTLPMHGGGGPISYGFDKGKQVTVVRIELQPAAPPAGKEGRPGPLEDFRLGSENEILMYIHELFHCFQHTFEQSRHGNLRFNNDENYSTYAEIEGLALERAFLEENDPPAKEYVRDFLVARQLKRRSMNETERMQESEEDVAEGTATYTELMTATLMNDSFHHVLSQTDDPFYYGFKYADSLKQEKLKMLRNNRSFSLSSRDKCYSFGCFQAMLLTRFSPRWREGFFQSGKMLDQTLDSLFMASPMDRETIVSRLKIRYGYDTIYARHAAVLGERNQAYELVQKRTGLTYIVNFKNTGEYLSPEPNGKASRVGLITIYPSGIKKIQIADVVFEGKETPMVNEQLYYVKWIDTGAKEGQKRYEVQGEREGNRNVYKSAVFTTGGFTLTAPKIEIKETKSRVKVTVLTKVK